MRWLPASVVFGVLFGLVAVIHAFVSGITPFGMSALLMYVLAFVMWQAMGASVSAVLVLIGTGYERARRRPLSIASSRVPRVIAAIAGVAVAAVALIFTAVVPTIEYAVLAAAGLVLAGLAAHRREVPWPAKYAVAALAASIAILALPREADWLSLTWNTADTRSHHHQSLHENCNGTNWNRRLDVTTLTTAVALRTSLTGNVGEIVPEQIWGGDRDDYASGLALVSVTGNVDVSWLACHLPLHKRIHIDTELSVSLHVTSSVTPPRTHEEPDGRRVLHLGSSAHCSATGSLKLQIDHVVTGVASCRDVREQLARHVVKEIERSLSKFDGARKK